jgi:hypothetical protein
MAKHKPLTDREVRDILDGCSTSGVDGPEKARLCREVLRLRNLACDHLCDWFGDYETGKDGGYQRLAKALNRIHGRRWNWRKVKDWWKKGRFGTP